MTIKYYEDYDLGDELGPLVIQASDDQVVEF